MQFSSDVVGLLALSALRGVGHQTLKRIAKAGWTFGQVIGLTDGDELIEVMRKAGSRFESGVFTRPWRETQARLLERASVIESTLEAEGVEVLARGDDRFPQSLLDLADPPEWLFVQGNPGVLSQPSITVVGTREPSDDGLWLTRFVGLCLSEWGCPTVSGLALGIDQSVHHSSVQLGLPTIAVLGTGILADYPKNAKELRAEIVEGGGALVTEYLPAESYSARNFVQRNRIQAALGRVLVPVEWRPKSGTSHTVRFAHDLGRPVAAIRMPHWALPTAPNGSETLFTIPGEESAFRDFVATALGNRQTNTDGSSDTTSFQFELFEEQ